MIKSSDHQVRQPQDLSSLLEDQDSGISAEEKSLILSQIDQMFDDGAATKEMQDLSYKPLQNGSLFPVLANIVVLFLTVACVWLLFALHNKQEELIINAGGSISSAEGTILREFRQQTEEELQELQTALSSLGQERDELTLQTEQLIEQHTREFEQELQSRLREERARLETSDISKSEVERRLQQYRDELTEQHLQELAVVRSSAEKKQEQLSRSYEKRIAEDEGDRNRAFLELGRIREQQEEAALLSQQISSAYLLSINALEMDNFDSARKSLAVIEDYLARDSVGSVPVTARRLPADREIVSALKQFISLKEVSRADTVSPPAEAGPDESGMTISLERDERIAELSESIDQLSGRLQSTQSELSQTQNRLGNARRELENLRELEKRFRSREHRFDTLGGSLAANAESESDEQDNRKILAALDDKLEILEALSSQTVRRQYPDMQILFTSYLDTFEQEYQNKGYIEALQDTRSLITSVNGTGKTVADPYFHLGGNELLQAATQLVEELELLVAP